MLGIFGNDVIDDLSIMATFADGKVPPVYATLEAAKVRVKNRYTFNNSALYESQESQFASPFFEIGMESFRTFFSQFKRAKSVDLLKTKEVLAVRRSMEVNVHNLQKQVKEVLMKLDRIRQLEQVIEDCRSEIERSKEFEFEVIEPRVVKNDLPVGLHTMTCLKCNFTCHDNCSRTNAGDKMNCWAIWIVIVVIQKLFVVFVPLKDVTGQSISVPHTNLLLKEEE